MNTPNKNVIHKDAEIVKTTRYLKAMSHPLRLKILYSIGGQEANVQSIVEQVGTTQSNVSQHLAILRDNGVLSTRTKANRVFYFVDDPNTLQFINMTKQIFCNN